MKRFLTLPIAFLLFGMLISSQLHAQKDATGENKQKIKVDSIELRGEVYDRMTSQHVPETLIEILRPDSSLISSVKGGKKGLYRRDGVGLVADSNSNYKVSMPKIEGNYIIKVSKNGYETKYVPYALTNLKKRDDERTAPKIYLSRIKVRNLAEFTVKASKVMFYHKGDTIVYNADAFMLPEGSMLDALIAQMPGVEIKDGGKIYVNGRFVESLLLNGKDFFKGNKDVMLENIGVYAVKDVAVYEKKDEMAEVLGERADVDKQYVMDVRLKKDYMAGNMINAEAGGGTKSRYLGRLFAMHYTNNSRISIYGNANNVNKMNKLSQAEEGKINIRESFTGITRKINGGLDYLADNPHHTWEVAGNVDANYTDWKNKAVTNAVNYLQTADNFDFSSITSRARDFSISTFHNFKIKKNRWNLELKPQFSYNKNRNNDETVAATFNREMQDLNENIIKAIFSGNYRDLQSALINRNLKVYEADGHGYDAQLQGSSRIKIPDSPDAVELKFTAKYGRKSLFGNTLQDLCFGSVPASSLLQNRFQSNRPQYDFKLQGLARYYFNIPFGSLNASYEYIHTQNRKNSDISLLEAMAENSMAEFVPGELPVPDLENSYTSKFYKNQHIIKLTWAYLKKFSKMTFEAYLEPKIFLELHDLFYHRGNNYADPHRSFVRFNIERAHLYFRKGNLGMSLTYRMQQNAPNLLNMVDIFDTTDPLNVRRGNPNLKNSTLHTVSFSYGHDFSKKFYHDVYLNLDFTDNDFVSGFRYDSATGARTIRTYNVSGNNSGSLQYNFGYRFGPADKFNVTNNISGAFSNYANMIGYDSEPKKQKVNSKGLHEQIWIGYRSGKLRAVLEGGIHWNKSRSEGPMITKNNSGDWLAGAFFDVRLPFNFSFNTEFRAVKRFGYVEDSMNTVNYLWDAQLGYSIAKGVWRITLDAKDILNQNKGIRYVVNATGRTQTLNTVLPRYLMLSVHYRFDFKPKRKK